MKLIAITSGEYSGYHVVGYIRARSIKVVEHAITEYFSENPTKAGEYSLDKTELFSWLCNYPKLVVDGEIEELHLDSSREKLLPKGVTYVAAAWWPESTYREPPKKPYIASTTSLSGHEDWNYDIPDSAFRAAGVTKKEARNAAESLAAKHKPDYRGGMSSNTTSGLLEVFTRIE